MIQKIFTMMGILALGFTAQAQIPSWVEDSVSMGPGYANDIYYSMKNGSQKVENNKNWHLGFSLSLADSASVIANHNGGTTFVRVYNPHKSYANWASVSLADTLTSNLMFNNDQGWYQGAFNAIPNSSPFNFGWGVYDPATHIITGDSVFIVKANGEFFKICIKKLEAIPMKWTFDVAKLTTLGADPTVTDSISKQPSYANNLFAYYNLATMSDTNREPAIATWDLQFLRYTTDDPLSGSLPNNTVVGVLQNRGITAVRVQPLDPDSAFSKYYNYTGGMSNIISTIGYNWKTFDLATSSWSVDDLNSYLVYDKPGNLYQLQFTEFGGSTNGNIKFKKRVVIPLSVNEVNSDLDSYSIYPNPAQNHVNIVLNLKKSTEASIFVTDLTGKRIFSKNVNLQIGLNAFELTTSNFAAGNYILSVQGDAIKMSQQISVTK